MKVDAYLTFSGRCEEAVRFYQRALGAQVEMMMRFSEAPDSPPPGMLPPGSGDKIMHSSFRIGDTMVMASDGLAFGGPEFKGFSLSIAVASEAEAERVFNALLDGGKVTMPLGKTFWSPRFGRLAARFGVAWMVNVVEDRA